MNSESVFSRLETPKRASRNLLRFRLSYQTMGGVVGLAETFAIIIAAILGETVYQWLWLHQSGTIDFAAGIGLIAAFIYISLARSAGLYRLPAILDPTQHFGQIVGAWAFGLLMLAAVLFLLKVGSDFSRGSFLTFSLFELPLLLGTRLTAAVVINSMIARGAIAGRAAVVIGGMPELERLSVEDLLHQFGLKEVGRIILESTEASGTDPAKRRIAIEDAIVLARQSLADEFVIAASWSQSDLLAEVSETLRNSPLPVRLLPDQVVRAVLDRRTASSLGQMLSVEIQRAPMSIVERAAKRLFDIVFASIAIAAVFPILAIAALAIKLDSAGPAIFRQRRMGFNERQFVIYKFRTMQVIEDGNKIVQAKREDPRLTRVGRWLRRTSIDELPQLFNVLKGDMSLVGPRPHAVAHDDQYKRLIETYCCRHHVKPGITGWAQINGLRGETSRLEHMQRRVEFDLWYINNWSSSLDLRILLRTCLEVLKHEAY